MKPSYIVIGIVIAVVVLGGIFLFQSDNNSQTPSLGMVTYTDEGYSPKELMVKKGDNVTFNNESSHPMWTASAVHPTHTVYPGSSILKCNTPEAGAIFDACSAVEPGKEWSFQFDQIGSWKYHDHLTPTRTGTITVE